MGKQFRSGKAEAVLLIMTTFNDFGIIPPFSSDGFVCFDWDVLDSDYWWGAVVGNFGDKEKKVKTKGKLSGPGQGFTKKKRLRYRAGTINVVAWNADPVEADGLYKFEFSLKKVTEAVSYACQGCPD